MPLYINVVLHTHRCAPIHQRCIIHQPPCPHTSTLHYTPTAVPLIYTPSAVPLIYHRCAPNFHTNRCAPFNITFTSGTLFNISLTPDIFMNISLTSSTSSVQHQRFYLRHLVVKQCFFLFPDTVSCVIQQSVLLYEPPAIPNGIGRLRHAE